ncbi:MAG: hypothetical protein ACRC8K_22665 [Waterburya sp.]
MKNLPLPLKLSLVNRKQLMQLKLLIFKLVLLNGIVGVILPVNAHSANETEAITALERAMKLYQQQGEAEQVETVKTILDDLQE